MRPLDNPDPPLSRIITEYNTRKTKKNISALTKFLFIVSLSASSGVLAHIHRDDNVTVLDLMVRMLCQINPLVFDLAVTTWCIFSKDISFFSYVFFLTRTWPLTIWQRIKVLILIWIRWGKCVVHELLKETIQWIPNFQIFQPMCASQTSGSNWCVPRSPQEKGLEEEEEPENKKKNHHWNWLAWQK